MGRLIAVKLVPSLEKIFLPTMGRMLAMMTALVREGAPSVPRTTMADTATLQDAQSATSTSKALNPHAITLSGADTASINACGSRGPEVDEGHPPARRQGEATMVAAAWAADPETPEAPSIPSSSSSSDGESSDADPEVGEQHTQRLGAGSLPSRLYCSSWA